MTERLGNGSLAGLSSDELRATIRAVLRDVLPTGMVTGGAGEPVPGSPSGVTEQVTLRTDADLDVFVRRLASLCEDPAQRTALREGHRRFRLPDLGSGRAAAGPGDAVRVDRGAVTERYVKRAAAEGVRLVVGPRAVLTPLARDRARTLGVIVDKER